MPALVGMESIAGADDTFGLGPNSRVCLWANRAGFRTRCEFKIARISQFSDRANGSFLTYPI